MNEHVQSFCSARMHCLSMTREHKDLRAEQTDAKRVVGGLLRSSMERHNLDLAVLPAVDDSEVVCWRRARVAPPVPPLTSMEEVLALVRDLASHVASLHRTEALREVARIVKERLGARVTKPTKEVLRKVKPPRNRPLSDASSQPAEVTRLASQYLQAVNEYDTTSETFRPAQKAVKEAKETLIGLLRNEETVRVRMDRPDGRASELSLTRKAPSAAKPNPSITYGARLVSALVLKAAAIAFDAVEALGDSDARRTRFDEVFVSSLREFLASHKPRDKKDPLPKLCVRQKTQRK